MWWTSGIRQRACLRLLTGLAPWLWLPLCDAAGEPANTVHRHSDSFVLIEGAVPDGTVTDNSVSTDAVRIQVDRLDALLQSSTLTRSSMRVQLTLTITNLRNHPVSVSSSQLTLISGQTSTTGQLTGGGEQLLNGELGPAEQRSGGVTFAFLEYHAEEHPLVLKWTSGSEQVFVVLNDELRRLHPFEIQRKGPGDRLAVIRTDRDLDILAMWPLHDQLEQLQNEGVERIVLSGAITPDSLAGDSAGDTGSDVDSRDDAVLQSAVPEGAVPPPAPPEDADATPQPSGSTRPADQPGTVPVPEITEEALLWLSPLRSDIPADGAYASIHTTNLKPFIQFQVTGFSSSQSRRFPSLRSSLTLAKSETEAVTQAMQSCYDRLPAEQVFDDIFQPDAGLRTAALLACIDRLTADQMRRLLEFVRNGTRDQQLLLIPPLSRLTSDEVLRILEEFSHSADADLSLVALQSLMESDHPRTTATVGRLWDHSGNNPMIRRTIVSAAIRLNDYRWNALLASHASQLLRYFAGVITDPFAADVLPGAESSRLASSPLPTQQVQSSQHAETLRVLLKLLPAAEHSGLLQAARSTLLDIQDSTVQDLAIAYIRQVNDEHDRGLTESYLRQRLAGPVITDAVADAAYRYPSPEWTEPLLAIYSGGTLTNPALKRKILTYTLRGATPEQLQSLIDSSDSSDMFQQVALVKHLAGIGHPSWFPLAEQMLLADGPNTNAEAIDLLAAEGSEASLMLLNHRLQTLIASDIEFDQPRLAGHRSLAERLITKLSVISHPEICRTLNRCLRHRSRTISDTAMRVLSAAHRRSPAFSLIEEAVLFKRDKKYGEALAKVNEATQADPFSAEALLYRASFLLRDDHLDLALADLTQANLLNPEEPSTLNTIALVLVRQGQVNQGVQLAEQTLQLDPLENSNLYNTSCTLARASEAADLDESTRTDFRCRAVDLLRQSISQGFSDLEHLLNDPDLVSLHAEPEWPVILKQLRQNEDRPSAPPP